MSILYTRIVKDSFAEYMFQVEPEEQRWKNRQGRHVRKEWAEGVVSVLEAALKGQIWGPGRILFGEVSSLNILLQRLSREVFTLNQLLIKDEALLKVQATKSLANTNLPFPLFILS